MGGADWGGRCIGCVAVTQSDQMPQRRVLGLVPLLALAASAALAAEFRIDTEPPRLFLQPRKLALLQKERDRQSIRWQQFEAVIKRADPSPERGLAQALYSRVSGEAGSCSEAVAWARSGAADLRQAALVFDWCRESVTAEQAGALAATLKRRLEASGNEAGLPAMRDRLLAAIALADCEPDLSERHIRSVMAGWERQASFAAVLGIGGESAGANLLALLETVHAVRDNLRLDLRQSARQFFQELPFTLLLRYYPAPMAGEGSEYFVAAVKGGGQPDAAEAVLARAASLSLVAYDGSSEETQFLHGFLMQDRFLMRDPRGAMYEFLWANPYQPGLSFHHAPLHFHSVTLGALFLRSGWEEDAAWVGLIGGELQVYGRDGLKILTGQPASKPVQLGGAALYMVSGEPPGKFRPPDVGTVYLAGLKPGAGYIVEMDGAKRRTETTDAAGILEIGLDDRPREWIRVR